MKKLAILSPLVLLATTALAQDSTCILQPSCSQLGYTSAEADCGTAKVLRCPFDVSQVACVGGSSGASGGGGGDGYNPYDPNNELGDVIALVIDKTATGDITFTYGGGNIMVDCGNGTIVGGSTSSSSTISCSYPELGKYTVKMSGDFTYYGGATGSPTTLLKLDKSGITKMSKVCGTGTNGVVPPLPSTLKDATKMFYECSGLNSPYPKLPDGLEVADGMFYKASNMSGDVSLPSSLRSAKGMYFDNKKLANVTGLENSQITDGSYMFSNCSALTKTVSLPSTLVEGKYMFVKTSIEKFNGLENTKITNGECMFANNTNLLTLPALPTTLTFAKGMFQSCSNMTGEISTFPPNISNAACMFEACSKITGDPARPSGLTRGDQDGGTAIFDATGSYFRIFYKCTQMTKNETEWPGYAYYSGNYSSNCDVSSISSF